MKRIIQTKSLQTKIGTIVISATDTLITSIHLFRYEDRQIHDCDSCTPLLNLAAEQLTDYFSGSRKKFDLPLDLTQTCLANDRSGVSCPSEFRIAVWRELCAIPYGETRSYLDIARAIGNPAAVRAIGGANHANPFIIVIPCHRVIQANGTIGGYAAGTDAKEYLLQLEAKYSN